MTGFRISKVSRGQTICSGKMRLFSFTLTDPRNHESTTFRDVPFPHGASVKDVLQQMNEAYSADADSHLDPSSYDLPVADVGLDAQSVEPSPFSYDKTLKPFDEVVVDTPPQERKSMAGKFVSLHEIPYNELSVKVLQARLRYLSNDREQADYDVVDDALARGDVILISREDLMPQFRHRALSLRTTAPHMFSPNAQRTIKQASRVAFVWSHATSLSLTDECLWLKDKPKVKARPLMEVPDSLEATNTMCDRLHWEAQGYARRFKAPGSDKDFHQVWEDAKKGKLVMFCLNDVELANTQKHFGATDYTADLLKPESLRLLAVCQQAVFANDYVSSVDQSTSCCFLKGGDVQ